MTVDNTDITKAFGLPETIDPSHEYIYRSGEHGIYSYWYKDNFDNYWKYTNAPQGHPDFDPYGGNAIMDPDQPMPHTTPQFYTEDGIKRNVAPPDGSPINRNSSFNPKDPRNIWLESYTGPDGILRFIYRDTDVKENLDLWVQHQLRVTDASIVPFRQYAVKLFNSQHPKDRIFGVLLMLVDQGLYEAHDLVQATVGDIEFIDNTVKLLGRKFVCDPMLLDFFTSLISNRDVNDPLFVLDTVHGKNPIGNKHLYSMFVALKTSPHFIIYWRTNQIFSRIVHRLLFENIPFEQVEEVAFNELARTLATVDDVRFLVDFKLKQLLFRNYRDVSQQTVAKSLMKVDTDSFGVQAIYSDLKARRPDELEFSSWLHTSPLHDITPEEEQQLKEQQTQTKKQDPTADNTAVAGGFAEKNVQDGGGAANPDANIRGAAPAPSNGSLPAGGDKA